MDQAKMKALYKKMVEPKIKRYPNGLIMLPVDALNEYHEAVGLPPEKVSVFNLIFPGAQAGVFDYEIGEDCATDTIVEIMQVYYFDGDTDAYEAIAPNKVLEESIMRRFYEGEILFNGILRVDHMGRIWIDAMPEDNINVEFMIALQPNSFGYEFYAEDNTAHCRVWFDGSTFYYEPLPILGADHPPC